MNPDNLAILGAFLPFSETLLFLGMAIMGPYWFMTSKPTLSIRTIHGAHQTVYTYHSRKS